jgi:hypothetical protein
MVDSLLFGLNALLHDTSNIRVLDLEMAAPNLETHRQRLVASFMTVMSIAGVLVGQPLAFNLVPQKSLSVDEVRQDLRQAKREIELLKTMVRSFQTTRLYAREWGSKYS